MNRLDRRRAAKARRRTRALLLVSLLGLTFAAVVFFATGLIVPGLAAAIAGLATVVAAGRHARPDNWTREDRDPESR